jgi:hypothetical protein
MSCVVKNISLRSEMDKKLQAESDTAYLMLR